MNLLKNYLPDEAYRRLKVEAIKRRAGARQRRWPDGWLPKDDGRQYIPHDVQAQFHRSTARFRCYFGGRGSGKTTAGAQEALAKRIARGLSGAVVNPDMENFKYSTWPEFKRWIPWGQVVKKDQRMGEFGWEPYGNFVLHFKNGATVYCKGLKNPDAARGPNINWLWYDEGGRDRDGLSFKLAIGGVRIGPDPAAWVTTTPRGKRHWTARMFVNQEIDEEVAAQLEEMGVDMEDMYWWGTGSIEGNRHNLDRFFYASMKTAYSGKFAEQELDGLVVDLAEEGLVYPTFSPENITKDAEYNPVHGPVELAYDDGFSNSPRVFLFVQRTEDGNILVFDEMYHHHHVADTCISEAKETLVHHAIKHASVLLPEEKDAANMIGYSNPDIVRIEIAVGDPAAAQLKESLRQADIPARGSKAHIREGIKHLSALVHHKEHGRRLLVHPRCKNLIREMSEDYQYPDGSKDKSDVMPMKKDDHGPDALRYWAWTRMRRA